MLGHAPAETSRRSERSPQRTPDRDRSARSRSKSGATFLQCSRRLRNSASGGPTGRSMRSARPVAVASAARMTHTLIDIPALLWRAGSGARARLARQAINAYHGSGMTTPDKLDVTEKLRRCSIHAESGSFAAFSQYGPLVARMEDPAPAEIRSAFNTELLPVPPRDGDSRAARCLTQPARSGPFAAGALRNRDSPRSVVHFASSWSAARALPARPRPSSVRTSVPPFLSTRPRVINARTVLAGLMISTAKLQVRSLCNRRLFRRFAANTLP
jgi:hypothetical protein